MIPCSTVHGTVRCDLGVLKAYTEAVFGCRIEESTYNRENGTFKFSSSDFAVDDDVMSALLTSLLTHTQTLTGFAESHLAWRCFLYAPNYVPTFALKKEVAEDNNSTTRALKEAVTC
jgi:hypothetical protein